MRHWTDILVEGTDQQSFTAYLEGAKRRLPKVRGAFKRIPMAYDPTLPHEATQRAAGGRDTIQVGSKFMRLPDRQRDAILVHEIGHWVSTKVGLAGWLKEANRMGIDPWDTESLPWGQFNMEEAFAESFMVAVLEHDKRWPEWQKLALSVAARAGL